MVRGLRLQQAEQLRAAAEAQKGREALPHDAGQLTHAATAGVAERVPVPSLRKDGIRARPGGVVPVVRAAEDHDRRRGTRREERSVELRIVALDGLERLSRAVVP